jgi:hypothetical protein
MDVVDWIIIGILAVILASYTYGLGYKDGRREAHLQASKWRKQVNNADR